MRSTIDLETLAAYVDGELDESQFRDVERRLAEDEAARQTVDDMRQRSAMLRAAFNEPLRAPIPERLLALFERTRNEAPRIHKSRQSAGWSWIAIAASVAAVLVSAPASYYLAGHQVDRKLAEQVALARADYDLSHIARAKALEASISGETLTWTNPDSGNGGSVMPVRTFKTSKGQWCREYLQQAEGSAERETRRAIACRSTEGLWIDRLEILGEI